MYKQVVLMQNKKKWISDTDAQANCFEIYVKKI